LLILSQADFLGKEKEVRSGPGSNKHGQSFQPTQRIGRACSSLPATDHKGLNNIGLRPLCPDGSTQNLQKTSVAWLHTQHNSGQLSPTWSTQYIQFPLY